MAGSWTTINLPQTSGAFNADLMILLTNGDVLVHNAYVTPPIIAVAKQWLRLTPDMTQSNPAQRYAKGSWSGIIDMVHARQYFASGILKDGRAFVVGGEYSDDPASTSDSPLGETFDPQTNTWKAMNKPSGFDFVRGDCNGSVLADGRVLFGGASLTGPPSTWSKRSAIWNPDTDTWKEAGLEFGVVTSTTKTDPPEEESWALLPDGSVLAPASRDTPKAERYVPSLDKWVAASQAPQNLALTTLKGAIVYEIGPTITLPDGNAVAIGGTGQLGIYTPGANPTDAGSWTQGPAFPADASTNPNWPTLTALDAPACLLPSGKVVCMGGTTQPVQGDYFSQSPVFLVYDPANADATLPQLDAQPSLPSGTWTYQCWFLLLPTGQLLCSCQSGSMFLYTPDPPDGPPQNSWRPANIQAPGFMISGRSYKISGTQINGLSQAVGYGDDGGMATNYPIVQLTAANGTATYLRSYNFSTMGVATGTATPADLQSCMVEVPGGLATGPYSLVVIANGIPSLPVTVTVVPPLNVKIPEEVAQILYGVVQDGGGLVIVGHHIIRIPPWDPGIALLNGLVAIESGVRVGAAEANAIVNALAGRLAGGAQGGGGLET
ncbi:MAG TPA: kelch repeat-containing protein [Bryobacteraceae bacterium]|jgi:hypothetical protein